MNRRIICIAFSLIVFAFAAARAQVGELTSVLEPSGYGRIYQDVGIYAGLGSNNQTGKFLGGCNCLFDKGAAFGFTLGALYERTVLSSWLRVGLGLGIDFIGLDNTTLSQENIPVTSLATGLREDVLLDVKHTAATRLASFNISPYAKYTFKHWLFFRLGLTYSLLINNSFTHDKELKTTKTRLSNGEIVNVAFAENGKTKYTIEDGEFPNAQSMLYLEPAIGLNIRLSNRILLSPIGQYGLPLNSVSSAFDGFKINKFRFLVELRYNLVED